MELIERGVLLATLQDEFEKIKEGEGRCIFLTGEAGIGKTAVVKAFCRSLKEKCRMYQGTCDALFTPRPLAPLYDILFQLHGGFPEHATDITDRTVFFTRIFQDIKDQPAPSVIVFEDIHWADEATLDFIKFFARRITQLPCLFVLTYRDNEIHLRHPLRNVLGQLNPDSFTRIAVLPLSRAAVEKMASEKGYSGEDVHAVSGGNPFYVNEILASYSPGIPDNIKDSVLAVYNRQDEKTKQLWTVLSILPTGLEINSLEKLDPDYALTIEMCLESKILVIQKSIIFFKHELYRRTIEASLSPLVRVALNKKILALFRDSFEADHQIERIIHHAKNANEYDVVVHYAPVAAKEAAGIGAHVEASKLFGTAIEYYQGNDKDLLVALYEDYAYECYLTNQIRESIIFTTRALNIWKEKNNIGKAGNCLRFLSRLWWFEGNREKAEAFGMQAIEAFDDQPSSKIKAMAYSNMSQLKMLGEDAGECVYWGEKALAMAKEFSDEETICHALNNIGAVQMKIFPLVDPEAGKPLRQSLEIALKNSYHEHAARAYTNLGSLSLVNKDYSFSRKILQEGISYCDERDLGSWKAYMLSKRAVLNLETGNWKNAIADADIIFRSSSQSPVIGISVSLVAATIRVRMGDESVTEILQELKAKSFQMMELQRIAPVLSLMLEYEWINATRWIGQNDIDIVAAMVSRAGNVFDVQELNFWLNKSRQQNFGIEKIFEGYDMSSVPRAVKAAALWERLGNSYFQALALSQGTQDDKRKALAIVRGLGAMAVEEKMKMDMRSCGIRNIPRGIRKTTQHNPAFLTDRELEVLRLLHEGKPNKKIASELFISAKTVDHHISSILFKLDAETRMQAVQEAARLGIVK